MRLTRLALALISLPAIAETPSQDIVSVAGSQWLQPAIFASALWEDVASTCDIASTGKCDGQINGIDLSGWYWADAKDVAKMFNAVTASSAFDTVAVTGRQHFMKRDPSWAQPFFERGFLTSSSSGSARVLSGYVRDTFSHEGYPPHRYFARIYTLERPYCDESCSVIEIDASWDFPDVSPRANWGFWFFRKNSEGGTPSPTD